MEKELEQIIEDLQINIPKSDWEKLQDASSRKNELEEIILDLYNRLEELENTVVD